MSTAQEESKTSTKEAQQRIVDFGFKAAHLTLAHMKELSIKATQYFFIMNGCGILALMTFLGTFRGLNIGSFICLLIGLVSFCIGLLYSTLFNLGDMQNSFIAFEQEVSYSFAFQFKIATDNKDFENIKKRQEEFNQFTEKEKEKSIRSISLMYSFFIFGVGFVLNSILYLEFTKSLIPAHEYTFWFLWLVGVIGSGVACRVLYCQVAKILTHKFEPTVK